MDYPASANIDSSSVSSTQRTTEFAEARFNWTSDFDQFSANKPAFGNPGLEQHMTPTYMHKIPFFPSIIRFWRVRLLQVLCT
jgi:hypothetical protein